MSPSLTKERRLGLGLLGAGALAILAVCAMLYVHDSRGLEYTIRFKDAKDLKRGDRVQLSGVDIGVVQSVDLHTQPTEIDVKVKIDPDHSAQIRSDSTAIIGGTGFPNVSGQKVIQIINPDSLPAQAPMPKYATIDGVGGNLELGAWKLKQKFAGAKEDLAEGIDEAREGLGKAVEQVKELRDSPEVAQATDQLRGFVDKMRTKGKSAASELAAEWPVIKAKMQPVLQKLTDLGRKYIVDQIKLVMGQVESTLADWRGTAPAAASSASTSPTRSQ